MRHPNIEVIHITKEPAKKWWLVYEEDLAFLDVMFATLSEVDQYRVDSNKRLFEKSFENEYDLLKFIIKESSKDKVMETLQIAKGKVDCVRLIISLQRELFVDAMIEELEELKKESEVPQNELDDYTTAADEFYLELEAGTTPEYNKLKDFMDGLVDVLEKQGGKVKQAAYAK